MIQKIIRKDAAFFMNTFGTRIPICFTSGKGVILTDTEGKTYIDLFAGIATNVLGYNHPVLTEALHNQIAKVIHTSNVFYVEGQADLAEKLVKLFGSGKVFFGNSGAEANEGAVKLARRYWKDHDPQRYKVLTWKHSFHGRTLAMVAATGQEKYQRPYSPLPEGFVNIPYGDPAALEAAIDSTTAAVMLEVIQGEGGILCPGRECLHEIESLCRNYGILLILDEVQTGVARTGSFFAYQHFGLQPDIVTLAKALGGGIPMSAIIATDRVSAFTPGDHGSTFGGNPLACAAGNAVVDIVSQPAFLDSVKKKGIFLLHGLKELVDRHTLLRDPRGYGLMVGVTVSNEIPVSTIVTALLEKGFVLGTAAGNTLRIVPPLIIEKPQIAQFLNALDTVCYEMENKNEAGS
ncbi:MAG: aspartate aminotransferase family protein [Christensenellales bacterium]|jgi:acetylornithine/N-succinyldiaminopimelate aminotransferase